MNPKLRKVVIIVAALNLAYFGVEFAVALAIDSVSLFADSIDFLEDASINFLILVALGWTARTWRLTRRTWIATVRDSNGTPTTPSPPHLRSCCSTHVPCVSCVQSCTSGQAQPPALVPSSA